MASAWRLGGPRRRLGRSKVHGMSRAAQALHGGPASSHCAECQRASGRRAGELYLYFANATRVAGLPQTICLLSCVLAMIEHWRIVNAEGAKACDALPGRRAYLRSLIVAEGMIGLLLQQIAQALGGLGVDVLGVGLQTRRRLLMLLLLLAAIEQTVDRLGRRRRMRMRRRRRRVYGRVVGFLGAWRGRILRRHDMMGAFAGVLLAPMISRGSAPWRPGASSCLDLSRVQEASERPESQRLSRRLACRRRVSSRAAVTRAADPLDNTKKAVRLQTNSPAKILGQCQQTAVPCHGHRPAQQCNAIYKVK